MHLNHKLQLCMIIVPTLVEGEGTTYSAVFFVQTILTDRYIHRRES